MKLGEQIYQNRTQKGLSIEELAGLCDVEPQVVSAWETNIMEPDRARLQILSENLHIRLDNSSSKYNQNHISMRQRCSNHNKKRALVYKSKLNIFGIPLLHINIGSFQTDDRRWRVAKGVIAIGNVSAGFLSIGCLSIGIINIGLLSLGLLCSIGFISLSYFAIGCLAIGYLSVGCLAIGVYSIGFFAIGYHTAFGEIAYGVNAIGVRAYGEQVFLLKEANNCLLSNQDVVQVHNLVQDTSLPWLFRSLTSSITSC